MTPLAPHTTSLRDQIITALREAYPTALSTNEIAEQLPPIVCQQFCTPCHWWCGPNAQRPADIDILECHGYDWHLIRRPRNNQDIHKHLCAMARRSRIVRLPYNRSANPCVFWTVKPDPHIDAAIDDLEKAWATS